jgi:hypothetical protein
MTDIWDEVSTPVDMSQTTAQQKPLQIPKIKTESDDWDAVSTPVATPEPFDSVSHTTGKSDAQAVAPSEWDAVSTPVETAPLDTNANFVGRSANRAARDFYAAGLFSGAMDQTAAIQGLAESEREALKYKYSPDVEEAFRNYPVDGSMAEVASWMVNNPKTSAVMLGDNSASIAISTGGSFGGAAIGGMLGGIPGAAAGSVAGAGLASGLSDYGSSLTQALQEAGVDTTSEAQITSAMSNPEFVSKANKQALLHGVSVGTIDAITSLIGVKGVAGKLINGIWTPATHTAEGALAKESLGRILGETGINTGIEAVGGGVGEGLGQYASTGQVKWGQLVPEMVLEVPGGAFEGALSTYIAHKNNASKAQMQDYIDAYGNPVQSVMPTAEEAAQREGRTLFGYDEGDGTPIEVFDDYNEAERRMGSGPARRGRLVAVADAETDQANDVSIAEKSPSYAKVGDAYREDANGEFKVLTKRPIDEPKTPFSSEQKSTLKAMGYDAIVNKATKTVEPLVKDIVKTPQQLMRGKRTYSGDTTRREVRPNLQNPLGFGETRVDDTGNGNLVAGGIGLTDNGTDIDGTKLFNALKGKVYTTPTAVGKAIKTWGADTIKTLLKISDEDLAQRIFTDPSTVRTKEWAQAVADGRVEYIPDNRLISEKILEFQNTTKDEVQSALNAATIVLPKGITKLSQLHRTLPGFVDKTQSRPDEQAFFETFPSGVSSWLPSLAVPMNEGFDAGLRVIENFFKQFGGEGRLVIVPRVKGQALTHPVVTVQRLLTYNSAAAFSSFGSNNTMIVVNVDEDSNAVYHNMIHEFGHWLSANMFSKTKTETRLRVFAAYRRWIAQFPLMQKGATDRRSGPGSENTRPGVNDYERNADYWMSFEEWFAEQVARFGTTDAETLGTVTKFFKNVSNALKRVFDAAFNRNPKEDFRAEPEIEAWIDSLRNGETTSFWSNVSKEELDTKTSEYNRPYLQSQTVPRQVETTQQAQILTKYVNNGVVNASLAARMNADTDRYNVFYKWGLSLRQMALRNPHLQPLARYLEWIDAAKLDTNKLMQRTDDHLREMRNLPGKGQGDALGTFMFELNSMTYLTPQEVQNNVRRHPTQAEFTAMAQRLGLSRESLALYTKIKDAFIDVVNKEFELASAAALKMTDPVARGQAMIAAQKQRRNLLSAPYVPMSRFGDWVVVVRGPSGKVEYREHFDTKKQMQAGIKEAKIKYPQSAGFSVPETMFMDDDAKAFIGMPPWVMDKLYNMPNMTPAQRQWVEILRYDMAPQRSFVKHLMKRSKIEGNSLDFRRVYADYMFRFARNYGRLKYGELADSEIGKLEVFEPDVDDPKKNRIAKAMREHWGEFINPTKDWAILRSLTAVWHLGFVPAAAAINISQVPLFTYPMLADKFKNDLGAMNALMKAAKDLSTYYKKGTIANAQSHEMRAMGEAIERGVIDESQAWELASMAGGSRSRAGQFVREAWLRTTSAGMFVFQMAEQWNRRVTFRAAYDMAYNAPQTKWVQDLKTAHFLQYQDLTVQRNWTDREALAFIAGEQMTRQTQFGYDKLERPRFMRGRKAAFFAFYMFTQNSLFTLWHNPGARARYMILMAGLAGPLGLVPDELEDILTAIGRGIYGNSFNLEREMRELITDLIPDDSKLPPDLILHGIGRYGFGIPWAMKQAGVDWLPTVDRSQSLSIQRVLPLGGVTSLLNPGSDWHQTLYDATQSVAGAAFGPMLAIANAMQGSDLSLTDMKRWEMAMPRAMRRTVEAGRLLIEGGERNAQGAKTMLYDTGDPQQVAEAIAIAMGYTTTRKSQFYDRREALYEIDAYWDTARQMQLQNAYNAWFNDSDPEAKQYAMKQIREFNKQVKAIDPKKMITKETLKRSFSAKRKAKLNVEQKGLPQGVSPGVVDDVDRLYPETVIQTKKVK